MSEERIAALERRFVVALALERIGVAHHGLAEEPARELLDALMEGDDPMSQLMRSQMGPRNPVLLHTVTPEARDG